MPLYSPSGFTYYVRAYALNSAGIAYGDEVSFTTALAVGDSYQGGIVAYILQSIDPGYVTGETHGIIAAPGDQSTGIEWGCSGTAITGAYATALGSGNQNTLEIMAGCASESIAARLCANLDLNDKTDWFLPSKNELNKLFVNRTAIGGFAFGEYWSSTEFNGTDAWKQDFSSGNPSNTGKSFYRYVRAIRTF